MRRLVAFIPFLVLAVVSCETESPTSPQADSRLAIYPTARAALTQWLSLQTMVMILVPPYNWLM